MKNWKIKRIYYISPFDLKTNDISSFAMRPGQHVYNFYQRILWVFWLLRRQMRDEDYFHLKQNVENDGKNIRELFIHSNF